MQGGLDLKDGDHHLVLNASFNENLENTDHNKMRRRETRKRAQSNLKSASGSNDNSTASRGIISKKSRKYIKKPLKAKQYFSPSSMRSGMTYSK